MIIKIEHLEKLLTEGKLSRLKLDLTDRGFVNSLSMTGGDISKNEFADLDMLKTFQNKKIDKISIIIDSDVLAVLRKLFPEEYQPAQFEEILEKIEDKLTMIEEMNKFSKKHRELILMQEVREPKKEKSPMQRVLYREGMSLTHSMLGAVKTRYGGSYKLQYSINENGILVFVNDPSRNISMKIDILAVFAKTRIPVYIAETVDEAYQIFTDKRPKMILMTFLDKATESKELFLRCSRRDPFLKFINYSSSPSANRDREFSKIMLTYNGDYKAALDLYKRAESESKPILDSKLRNPIMDRLEILRNNYTYDRYIEMQYYLFRLGLKYNVRTMEIMLAKIKSDNEESA